MLLRYADAIYGFVTLVNEARNKNWGAYQPQAVATTSRHVGIPEGSVRSCGGEMALDVEGVLGRCMHGKKSFARILAFPREVIRFQC